MSTRTIAKDFRQFFVPHLGQRWIHHDDQPNGNRDVRRAGLKALHEIRRLRDQMPESNANCHGEKNPQRQVAIQEGQPGARHWGADLALGMESRHHVTPQ